MMDFTATSPMALPISQTGSRASSRKSMFMPTVKKNRPSRRPLKGSMAVSIALRNSVSASSRPATKAPSAIEKPATAAATPVATITNSVVATNRSLMPADATRRNSGRITTRPTTTITPSAMAALASASMSVAGNRTGLAGAENGDEQQERRHCQVLRQQDRETGPARTRVQPSLPGKHFDDDGGRGQRQAGTEDERHRRLAAGKDHDCCRLRLRRTRSAGCPVRKPGGASSSAAHRTVPCRSGTAGTRCRGRRSRRRSWRRPR